MNKTSFDLTKQDESTEKKFPSKTNKFSSPQEIEIRKICDKLASVEFDEKEVYLDIQEYINKYERWLYSTVSNYLFTLKDTSTFMSNLDILNTYVKDLPSEHEQPTKNIKSSVIKLWDHSNLAAAQTIYLHDSEDIFSQRVQKNLIPFKAEFAHEMNMHFISLIAIFTALSFIVFGGISSLDNIFNGAKNFPILILMIIGSIWSLFICNLVFVFMLFVSKFTKIPIKMSEKERASLSEKYPFIVWCNYIFLLILTVASWLYYVDYSDSGIWLLRFSREHLIYSFMIGISTITAVFIGLAFLVLRHPKSKKEKS